MVVGVPPAVFQVAVNALLELQPFQVALLVFGVGVVLIFSLFYIWRHAKEGKV